MDYEVKQSADGTVVLLSGKMTMRDHETFQEMLATATKATGARIVFDMRGLDFIDSAGLGFLLIARERSEDSGRLLALRAPQPHVRRLLDLGEFGTLMPIEP